MPGEPPPRRRRRGRFGGLGGDPEPVAPAPPPAPEPGSSLWSGPDPVSPEPGGEEPTLVQGTPPAEDRSPVQDAPTTAAPVEPLEPLEPPEPAEPLDDPAPEEPPTARAAASDPAPTIAVPDLGPHLRRARDAALVAVAFLTIVPVPAPGDPESAREDAPALYALVGAAIGLLAGLVFAATEPSLGGTVAAILALAALVIVTGGLHQDGLADCADGLGVRGDPARRLTVMRDPTVGTFGTLALVISALLFVTAVGQLSTGDAVAALVAAAAIGRWAALLHGRWTPSARPDGLGSGFAPSPPAVIVAGVCALVVAAIGDLASAVPAVLAGVLTAALTSAFARRAFGGRTGDTLGATVVLTELVVLLVLLGFARH